MFFKFECLFCFCFVPFRIISGAQDEVLATELQVIMESVKVTGGFDNAKL